VIKEQQTIADRFYALGLINKPVRVRDAVWQFSSALALIE
jgi:ABC-type nitrate/sulfonate/bicarbonate transport system substrate-binding protein